MADPVFPVGGVDLRRGHFLVKMYTKMKELGRGGWGGVRNAPQIRQCRRFIAVCIPFSDDKHQMVRENSKKKKNALDYYYKIASMWYRNSMIKVLLHKTNLCLA